MAEICALHIIPLWCRFVSIYSDTHASGLPKYIILYILYEGDLGKYDRDLMYGLYVGTLFQHAEYLFKNRFSLTTTCKCDLDRTCLHVQCAYMYVDGIANFFLNRMEPTQDIVHTPYDLQMRSSDSTFIRWHCRLQMGLVNIYAKFCPNCVKKYGVEMTCDENRAHKPTNRETWR